MSEHADQKPAGRPKVGRQSRLLRIKKPKQPAAEAVRAPDGRRFRAGLMASPLRAFWAVASDVLLALWKLIVSIWRIAGVLDEALWDGIMFAVRGVWSLVGSSLAFFVDSLIELARWLPTAAGRAYCAGAAVVATVFGLWVLDEMRRAATQTGNPELIVLPPADPDNPIVARVAGRFVRLNEIRQAFVSGDPDAPPLSVRSAFERGLVETYVEQRLLARAGAEEGLMRRPEIAARVNVARERILAASFMNSRIEAATAPERVRRLYDSQADLVRLGDEVKARHIVVETKPEAEALVAQIEAGGDFQALARAHSLDPSTKNKGGEIGYFTRHMMTPVLANAAFTTGVDDIAPLFYSQFGWHVLQVQDRRPAPSVRFETVEDSIRDFLRQQAIDDTLRELSADSEIIYFPPEQLPEPSPADAAPNQQAGIATGASAEERPQ